MKIPIHIDLFLGTSLNALSQLRRSSLQCPSGWWVLQQDYEM